MGFNSAFKGLKGLAKQNLHICTIKIVTFTMQIKYCEQYRHKNLWSDGEKINCVCYVSGSDKSVFGYVFLVTYNPVFLVTYTPVFLVTYTPVFLVTYTLVFLVTYTPVFLVTYTPYS